LEGVLFYRGREEGRTKEENEGGKREREKGGERQIGKIGEGKGTRTPN